MKVFTKLFEGLSLKRDILFIPNLILCFGVVAVWRGMWNLMDTYFFPEYPLLSNILTICIGIGLIYLPDNSFTPLGGFKGKKSLEHQIAREVTKLLQLNKQTNDYP